MKKLLVLLIIAALLTVGCSKPKDKGENKVPPPESKVVSQTTSDTVPTAVNPFTGEIFADPQSALNRPLAVMINNIGPALPQSGIGSADVIFELPVEGTATRLMAVFADYTAMPTIGSVRSSRHDYVELIKPFNPLYLHFGYSDAARDFIADNNIDNINGIQLSTISFYQDKNKLKSRASEHTWFSSLEYLKNGIEEKGYQATMSQPIEPMFKFAKDSAMLKYTDAIDMPAATIRYSSGANATFEYNNETGLYNKLQNGKPHIDENIGSVCQIKNVLVMYTKVGILPNTKNKDVDLSQGTGYYLSEGKQIEVTFQKPSIDSYIKVYDKTGEELQINTGNTWFCISPTENKGK